MEMTTLAAAVSPSAAGSASVNPGAQRFSDLLRQKSTAPADVYLNGPAAADNRGYIADVASKFQALDFKVGPAHTTGYDASRSPDEAYGDDLDDAPGSEVESLKDVMETSLKIQMEILRTALMLETVNVSKQGVTTLFQQQG
jgi:hypothetical protein